MKRGMIVWAIVALVLAAAPAAAGDDADWHWFGSLRVRPEYNENLSDLTGGRDDKIAYAGYRANLGLSVDLDRDVTLLFDGQALGVWGEDPDPFRGGTTQDTTSADFNFYRAYVEAKNIFGTKLSVRAGRQTLVFGDEWLLGDYDFYGGTSWDGIRADFARDTGTTSVFWAKVAETNTPEQLTDLTINDIGGDSDLYGFWGDWDLGNSHLVEAGVMYLLDHQTIVTDSGTATTFPFDDKRWTITLQYAWGEDTGAFVRANTAMQTGETLDASIPTAPVDVDIEDAYAFEVTGGYVFERDGQPYRLWARIAEYTGDDDTTPNENETFVPIAQDNHARYGLLDFWQGQWGFTPFIGGSPGFRALQVGVHAELANGLDVMLSAQELRRAERVSSTVTSRQLGREISLGVGYNYGENLRVEAGVAQLYPSTAFDFEPPFFASSITRRYYLNTVVNF